MVKEQTSVFLLVKLNELNQPLKYECVSVPYIIVFELAQMLSLLILLDNLSTDTAFRGVAVAGHSVRRDVSWLDHLLAVGTQHRLHVVFDIVVAVLALLHSLRCWCTLYLANAASLGLGI